ncbi:MAG: VCBS repeat-containing protein [Planctomycetaceae bacterium]|nr:VCBS repeat-containing protein [Planctomycetaceae bacterium]
MSLHVCQLLPFFCGVLLASTPHPTAVALPQQTTKPAPWTMHVIDDASRGADGVRLGDFNADGLPDIVTGWEEGGQIRICLNPGLAHVHERWPSVCVGNVPSPEDAVPVDVNGDGLSDVVSSCEGNEQAIYVHLHPGRPHLLDANQWTTRPVIASQHQTRWMFCLPFADAAAAVARDRDPNRSADAKPPFAFVGSKDPHGQIAVWNRPEVSSTTEALLNAPLAVVRTSGWIMSLRQLDIDGDGHSDVLYSDRKGPRRGIGWLRQPTPDYSQHTAWTDQLIAGTDREVMFLDTWTETQSGSLLLACNCRHSPILLIERRLQNRTKPDPANSEPNADITWKIREIQHPQSAGTGKGIAIGDINGDGQLDLVCSCENAEKRIGVFWLAGPGRVSKPSDSTTIPEDWPMHDISGSERGVKFDRIELLDLDNDGDLDVLTCEERHNLGVIWYENPQIP